MKAARRQPGSRAWIGVASRVIRECEGGARVEDRMRDVLRHVPLGSDGPRRVAIAVHAYYCWRGWLDAARPMTDQVEEAVRLDARFQAEPEFIPEEELAKKAVPAWVHETGAVDPCWLRVLQRRPVLWLRWKAGQVRDGLERLGPAASAGPLPDSIRYTGIEDLFRTPEFHAGRFEIQDLSSQAVGRVCSPAPGERWWDMCAGEGGKTLHLAEMMENRGVVWATDRARWRLARLKRRAARAGCFNVRLGQGADLPARELGWGFHGVLVDAPCTGLGTWQRNPQARWTTRISDVTELSTVQRQLLRQAAAAVKPGGRLVYAVCTLTPSETDEVANEFERGCPGFEPELRPNPLDPVLAAARHTFSPWDHGGNGMFVAAWKRTR